MCFDFLLCRLDPFNCLGIRDVGDLYGCQDLYEAANDFALTHFEQVATGEEFYALSLRGLLELISSDKVGVDREEVVSKRK